ncbi:MAG: pyrroline-5-carboxylate reductase [Lachnospiraceae bacterium]|nr:pyrroline-5-carboxylate reductase [Lachnospiraceae bacterium]
MKIGFIGLGNMGGAMIGGMLAKGIADKDMIMGADSYAPALEKAISLHGIRTATDNREVAAFGDILILAVKPQMMAEVITAIRDDVPEETVVISIAAGKTLDWLNNKFGRAVKLVRVMPNTPALVGEGISGVCRNRLVSDEDMKRCIVLLESFGQAEEVPEHLMDAVVGVGGSAPGYVFMFIEAIADGGVAAGMPRSQALRFAAQSVLGSARMVLETGKHPAELKDMVCSPGGTTIEAVSVLEEKGLRGAVMAAVAACVAKSKSL